MVPLPFLSVLIRVHPWPILFSVTLRGAQNKRMATDEHGLTQIKAAALRPPPVSDMLS